ncbi:MAG TPA: hypothetical protein PLZ57_11250 [Pseudobdellovibrionaceae bacterium]|nr:hypothetical protein [Pseudobdellovibrionaceae bacterium]
MISPNLKHMRFWSALAVIAAICGLSSTALAQALRTEGVPEESVKFSCAIHEVGKAPAAVVSLEVLQPISSLNDRLVMNVTSWTIDNRQSATLRLVSIADDRMPDVFRVPVHGGLWLGSGAQLLLTRLQVLERQIRDLVVMTDGRAVGYSCERSRPQATNLNSDAQPSGGPQR